MNTDELREKYLSFFESKGHVRRASDVLVPTMDPSVLFTPAGMNQFKDHFLGKIKLDFTRATTSQKCLRTGDIDNVGRTAYHHTFFEMLGNFSFGDYFKLEAIEWAWEFLTSDRWLGFDPNRLSVSVYQDDDQAAQIWTDRIKLPAARVERMDEDENFWPAGAPSQGPDGVCGPCSEIFYHLDEGHSVEIWNLVFTQFNRVGEPPNNLRPLPSQNIDTGMGLERTASVLQGTATNYHIDILLPIVQAAADICATNYQPDAEEGRRLRRITDHIRACTFAIHENVYPGPNKEKYVIRRLLRRAVLDGHQLGQRQPFLFELVPVVTEMMQHSYPELSETTQRVQGVVQREEENYFATIDAGLPHIDKIIANIKQSGRIMVDGQQAADLYQTHGIPPELVESIAVEHNLTFDWDGFATAMEMHGEASGGAQFELFKTGPIESLKKAVQSTEFLGYETTEADAEIKAIIADDQLCNRYDHKGDIKPLLVVLDRSPFYGEAGGQVGDTGEIVGNGFKLRVVDTQRDGDMILHHSQLMEGTIKAGASVKARVDQVRRQAIQRAHSATHILHHALQKNLGQHAQQQGSKVVVDELRFDFTNLKPVSLDQLAAIEQVIKERISAGEPIRWDTLPLDEARTSGAMMLFGEKYPDPVRMVSMGTFSKELCGGTHLKNTREVEAFEIISEEAVAAGTRRIVALTGEKARQRIQLTKEASTQAAKCLGVSIQALPDSVTLLAHQIRELKKSLAGGGNVPQPSTGPPPSKTEPAATYAEMRMALQDAARTLNVAPLDVSSRITALLAEGDKLRDQLQQRSKAGPLSVNELLERAVEMQGAKLVIAETPAANAPHMRQLIDEIRKKAAPAAVLLASRQGDDKVTIVAGVSRDLQQRGADACRWVRDVAQIVGGSGGGRSDMAQAGGKWPDKLPEALHTAAENFAKMMTR